MKKFFIIYYIYNKNPNWGLGPIPNHHLILLIMKKYLKVINFFKILINYNIMKNTIYNNY